MSKQVAGEEVSSPALLVRWRMLADPSLPETAEDDDDADLASGVDEDALEQDEVDTDRVTSEG